MRFAEEESWSQSILSWWAQTTDLRVLRSPWICGIGRACRVVWTSIHLYVWCVRAVRSGNCIDGLDAHTTMFIVMWYFWASSLWILSTSSWPGTGGTMYFSLAMVFSFYLLSIENPDFYLHQCLVYPFIGICYCNVHPFALLLAVLMGFWSLPEVLISARERIYDPYGHTLSVIHAQSSLCILLCAFTVDRTNRIKAVSSGMLFDRNAPTDPLKSPLAGRSARKYCWLIGLNNWLIWIFNMLVKHNLNADCGQSTGPICILHRNHLPRCSTAAVFLGILSFLLEVRLSDVPGWTGDFAFALFCCLPASLLACDWALAFHDLLSQKMPYAYTFGSYFAGKFASQFLIAIHTLQQAGCHPLVIAGTVAFLTWFSEVAWPFRFNDEVLFWKGYLSVQCIACIFAWSILTIYSVNYFVHLRALREALGSPSPGSSAVELQAAGIG